MNVAKKHIRRRNNAQIEEINKKKAEGNDMTVDTLINNSNIRAMVVLVTPEIASEWLKSNTNNNNFNKISLIKFFNYLIQQICKGSGFRSFRFFQMNKTKQFITL